MGIEEAPSGFLLTTVENLAGYFRKGSLWPVTFGLACCAIEMMATGTPRFDISRFGMEVFRASPRQADLMIVAGRVSQKMAPVVRQVYDQMPEPKWVLSMGVCASSGGMFNNYAIVQGVDHIVPVDIYLPGLPAAARRCCSTRSSRCTTRSRTSRSASTAARPPAPPRPPRSARRRCCTRRVCSGERAAREPPEPREREGRPARDAAAATRTDASPLEPAAVVHAAVERAQQEQHPVAPERGGRDPLEVVDVRTGMFGAADSGDTSGYGGLVRRIALPGPSERPYGGWFDEVVDVLAEVLDEGADTAPLPASTTPSRRSSSTAAS